mmetsp:Transcript_45226/g.73658  ORF Transcript_45226/g.73658 Transcript_45226/m.73658 type:complete len:203 (+) Transcript_45226:1054-1662(+)
MCKLLILRLFPFVAELEILRQSPGFASRFASPPPILELLCTLLFSSASGLRVKGSSVILSILRCESLLLFSADAVAESPPPRFGADGRLPLCAGVIIIVLLLSVFNFPVDVGRLRLQVALRGVTGRLGVIARTLLLLRAAEPGFLSASTVFAVLGVPGAICATPVPWDAVFSLPGIASFRSFSVVGTRPPPCKICQSNWSKL